MIRRTATSKRQPKTSSRRRGIHLTEEETADAKQAFLAAFEVTGVILDGCKAANVDRETVRNWTQADDEFRRQYDEALAEANELLEKELMRRAYKGVIKEKHFYYEGEHCGTQKIREYSDTLAMFIAKKRMPEYRDKIDMNHAGKDGGPLVIEFVQFAAGGGGGESDGGEDAADHPAV